VAVNCSGIPETLLESELFGHMQGSFTGAYRNKRGLVRQAEGGTLFLDELGEMSLRMQAVLLRFTETGEIQPIGAETPAGRANVRLIAATNRDLRAGIASGTFREDLYYRLNVITIRLPPLRDRGDDVLLLLEHFVALAAQEHGLPPPTVTPDAAQLLVAYAWPGNIRELRNVTERLVVCHSAGLVTPDDLPPHIRDARGIPNTKPTAIAVPPSSSLPLPDGNAIERVQQLWNRLQAGEDFWAVVHSAFKGRELARADLAALIDRGLQETHGSYRTLVTLFHLPPTDYKRFHAFLYQQQCNLPVAPYRMARIDATSRRRREGLGLSKVERPPAVC
jgi:DNA-binding NtrC family response regulator